jgi:hypothetical protein
LHAEQLRHTLAKIKQKLQIETGKQSAVQQVQSGTGKIIAYADEDHIGE